VKLRCKELLDAELIELSNGEYVYTMVILAKKDVLENWTKKQMCSDYHLINKKTKLHRYSIPTREELFDGVGKAKIFSTLDLRSR